jgi:hypothetical protein
VRQARETNVGNLLTGDDSWFDCDHSQDSAWAPSRDPLPTLASKKSESKKCLTSLIWSPSGIHSFLALLSRVRYNTEFFCTFVLPNIERSLCDGKRKKRLRGIYLHLDDTPVRNAKRPPQEITQTKSNMVAHRARFPDGSPGDLFLFGHLKREMGGSTMSSAKDILSQILRIFERIPRETFTVVYN